MFNLNKKDCKDIAVGLSFLLPNICGFLTFVAGPLVISLMMAFTNWNLELHNVFKTEEIKFIGLENFRKLIFEPDFLRNLGNTLFFMMGIPFGMTGSLCAALLLNKDMRGGSRKVWVMTVLTLVMVVSFAFLILMGMGASAMTLLVLGLAGVIVIGGSSGGQTVYRTLFYFPCFTAGVATYILWKKLYNPETGPINNALRPLLNFLAPKFAGMSIGTAHFIAGAIAVVIVLLYVYALWRTFARWRDSESGSLSLIIGYVVLSFPCIFSYLWTPFHSAGILFPLFPLAGLGLILISFFAVKRDMKCPLDRGMANAIVLGGAVMILSFILLGISKVIYVLPEIASDGLEPPQWIADYYWAKPSLMLMGLWAAIGSNNMLLYLAGLSGVPQELYEAADIDGANAFQRFWHVTWPQLANVTFFILVMSVIGGLQGGFEMARTMTQGGPAGATTTLSYYIYTEGFATGRLGYASAVAWALFALIFCVTLFNWKCGNRYTND